MDKQWLINIIREELDLVLEQSASDQNTRELKAIYKKVKQHPLTRPLLLQLKQLRGANKQVDFSKTYKLIRGLGELIKGGTPEAIARKLNDETFLDEIGLYVKGGWFSGNIDATAKHISNVINDKANPVSFIGLAVGGSW